MKLNSLFFIIIFSILLLEKGYTQEKDIFSGFEGGAGPMHWEELADILAIDIYLCREGAHQSPININNALDHSPSQLLTDFSPTSFVTDNEIFFWATPKLLSGMLPVSYTAMPTALPVCHINTSAWI